MKIRILLILLFIYTYNIYVYAQADPCSKVTYYHSGFDSTFQAKYISVKADTVLAVRHCRSTNGCSNTIGLLCWKENGKYHFYEIERYRGKIKATDKPKKKVRKQLIRFFDQKLYEKTGTVETIYADDGSDTRVLFKTSDCWHINFGAASYSDARVKWALELLDIAQSKRGWRWSKLKYKLGIE